MSRRLAPGLWAAAPVVMVVPVLISLAASVPGSTTASSAASKPENAPRGSVLTRPIEREVDAAAQWEAAVDVEQGLVGSKGRDRLARRLTAIEAFRRVHGLHDGDDDDRARGALAAGRHLATLEFHDEARSEFDAALRLAQEPRLVLEARLARADTARRAGDWEAARSDYAWCADALDGSERVSALVRLGDACTELGQPRAARAAWTRALEHPVACTELVDAYDRLARAALSRGDDAGAAGWLEACRTALRGPLSARTPDGERLRRALQSMRARYELACRSLERSVYADG